RFGRGFGRGGYELRGGHDDRQLPRDGERVGAVAEPRRRSVAVAEHEVRRLRGERDQRAIRGERGRFGSGRLLGVVGIFFAERLRRVRHFAGTAPVAVRDAREGAVAEVGVEELVQPRFGRRRTYQGGRRKREGGAPRRERDLVARRRDVEFTNRVRVGDSARAGELGERRERLIAGQPRVHVGDVDVGRLAFFAVRAEVFTERRGHGGRDERDVVAVCAQAWDEVAEGSGVASRFAPDPAGL